MFESLNSPSIHIPLSLSEFSQTAIRYDNARIWAGGTAIMSREKNYPSRDKNPEVLYINRIEDLKKVARNDRMIEIGSTVTLNEILKSHRSSIPTLLKDNIEDMGSPLLTERATIGGAIATVNPMSTIPGTLIVLGANAEIRSIRKKKVVKSRWTPLNLLVNVLKNGQISLPQGALITRLRISLQPSDFSYFREEGSYIDDVEDAVAVSFTANEGTETLINPHIAITFPTQGIVYSKDLDNVFLQLHFPLSREDFQQLMQIAYTFINAVTPNITKLQKSRLNYIFEDMINNINTRVLAPSTFESGIVKGNQIE